MDSKKLSARVKQPGHDRTFVASEANFSAIAREVLDPKRFTVEDHPRDLAGLFAGLAGERALGLIPEASITSQATGRKLFVEVKKQGPRGNAEERACKHHTVQFCATLKQRFGYSYHPFLTVFCEELATNPRYTRKARFLFEPKQYLLWVGYDREVLRSFLNERCNEWLEP